MPNRVTYTFVGIDKASAAAKRVAASMAGVRRQMAGVAAQAGATGAAVSKAGAKMRATSAAAGLLAGFSVKAFADLDQGVTNVLTLLSDDAAVQKFGGTIRRLAEDTIAEGFAIDATSAALFANVQALGASEKSFAAYRAALDLARATNTDIETTVGGVTKVIKAYGLEATDATKVTDAFVVAQRKGIKVSDLAENVAKVAPLAKQAGIGFEELFATTAQLVRKGMDPGQAAIATRSAIVALIKPTKKAEGLFKALGIPVGVAELRTAGLAKTLGKLSEVSAKYPDLLDQLIPNVKALTAVAGIGAPELAEIAATMAEINAAGQTGLGVTGALAKQEASFADAMGDAIGEAKVLASMIGEGLAPVVRVLGFVIHGIVAGLRAVGPTAGKILGGILGIVAAAAPVLLFFGKFLVVAKFIGLAIAAAFSLPGAIVVGLVAATAIVIANFDAIKEKALAVKNAVAGFGSGLAGKIAGFMGAQQVDVSPGDIAAKIANQTDINVNLNAPKGTIANTKTRTSGDTSGLNVAVNMQEAF